MADLPQEGVTSNGLIVYSYDDILNYLQDSLNQIYAVDGDTINFGSETPDGQVVNIISQLGTDVRELAQGVYNSFDPDKCTGSVQDSRYAINYILRHGGTFTIQNIDVTVDKTVTLQGLDANYNDPNAASYTVSDNAGNLWYLIDTTTLTAGVTSLPFRSQNYGSYQSAINTINNQVTKVLGVVNITNSIAATTLGVRQESDAEFRLRRERSTAVRGQNNYDALLGQLLELNTVSDARVFINNTANADTSITDKVGGIPPYTVWVIVDGGANLDIANIIYSNSVGLATIGDVEVDVQSVSGQTFTTYFDRVNPVPLYIRFDIKITTTGLNLVEDGIKQYIADNLIFGLGEPAETSNITEIAADSLASYNGGLYALNVEISLDGENWTDFIASASLQDKFVVDTTRIIITQV